CRREARGWPLKIGHYGFLVIPTVREAAMKMKLSNVYVLGPLKTGSPAKRFADEGARDKARSSVVDPSNFSSGDHRRCDRFVIGSPNRREPYSSMMAAVAVVA